MYCKTNSTFLRIANIFCAKTLGIMSSNPRRAVALDPAMFWPFGVANQAGILCCHCLYIETITFTLHYLSTLWYLFGALNCIDSIGTLHKRLPSFPVDAVLNLSRILRGVVPNRWGQSIGNMVSMLSQGEWPISDIKIATYNILSGRKGRLEWHCTKWIVWSRYQPLDRGKIDQWCTHTRCPWVQCVCLRCHIAT